MFAIIIILVVVAAAGVGAVSLRRLDIDAFPDTTPVQVQIMPSGPRRMSKPSWLAKFSLVRKPAG